jgi:hypothetical protein
MKDNSKNKGCYYCKNIRLIEPLGGNPICTPGLEAYDPLEGWVLKKFECKIQNRNGDCEYFDDRGEESIVQFCDRIEKERTQELFDTMANLGDMARGKYEQKESRNWFGRFIDRIIS